MKRSRQKPFDLNDEPSSDAILGEEPFRRNGGVRPGALSIRLRIQK